jgi:hypothetical protein
MLVSSHVGRKQKEDLRIKSMLGDQTILRDPCPPRKKDQLTIDQVRLLVSNLYLSSGISSTLVPNLSGLLKHIHLPGFSRTSSQAFTAIKWYWAKLKWPQQVDPLNRGVSWGELYLDFACASNCKIIGSTHSMVTKLRCFQFLGALPQAA